MNNSSKFGEKITITEEDFIELKLSQKPWIITSIPPDLNITAVITEIYETTNLFSVINKRRYYPIEITPKVEIVLKYDGEVGYRALLSVEYHYFANS